MGDISNQFIKDTFDYILQSDINTGIIYRIGGEIPINPIFSSGLTINNNFKLTNGTEKNGYVLTCDDNGNALWKSVSGDIYITGGTYDNGTITFTNNSGNTFTVTGLFTGSTDNDQYLSLSGGTLSGSLYGTMISATTFYGNGTGLTLSNNQIINGLGYVPYNNTNPNGYISGITSGNVTTALGYVPYNNTNPNGYITGYTDTYSTGGTYSNGNLTLNNNLGGSFTVNGLSTGTTAGGSSNNIQFNNNGAFSGTTGLTYSASVLNNAGEYRLTTPDSYYSRLQRSSTGNTTYLKGMVNKVGSVGQAINLAGTSYFTSADTGLPSGTKPTFSISFWYFANSNSASNFGIVGWGTSGVNIFQIHQSILTIQVYNSSGVIIGGGTVNYNQWNHVVYTSDGTNNRLYLNNVAITPTTTTYTVNLGGTFANNRFFNSNGLTIDQLLIYSGVTLSTGQISSIYSGGTGTWNVPTSGLTRRYDFEGNGTDSVGGYTVTLNGAATYTTGYIPTIGSGSIVEGIPITYSDGINASERGSLYLGDISSGTWLQGLSIKTLINNNTIPFIIGTNGKVLINSANTSQTTLSQADLNVIGNVGIGTFAGTIPTGGLNIATSNFIRLYNSIDSTNTNYEGVSMLWSSNQFSIVPFNGGTGVTRIISFGGGTGNFSVNGGNLSAAGNLTINGSLSNVTGTAQFTGNVGIGQASTTGNTLTVNGSVLSKKINLTTGSNTSVGTVILTGGTATVTSTAISISSLALLTVSSVGGTQGFLSYITSTGSLVITSSSILDTSTVNWLIVN